MPRPTYTPLPTSPSIGDPNFATEADAFLGALPTHATYLEELADWLQQEFYSELDSADTAAAPSMRWLNDANTGLFHAGADAFGGATNGVERWRTTNAGFQITGLLSGTAVTQSATDTTAGRLMKVGDYGWGATRPNTGVLLPTNLNDVLNDGGRLAAWDTGVTNAPFDFGSAINLPGYDHSAAQIVVSRSKTVPRMAFRGNGSAASADPSPWREVLTDADKTQSATDATAGRLLKVGDFGLGSKGGGVAPQVISDFTADIAPGFYQCLGGTGSTGGPDASNWQATVIVSRGQNERTAFIYFRSAGANSAVWTGVRATATGAVDWVRITPERGSNATGEYVRLADGTQITQQIVSVTDITLATGSIFYLNGEKTITYPAAFITTQNQSVIVNPRSSSLWGKGRANNTTSGKIQVMHGQAANGTWDVEVTCIGRWY